MKSLRILRVSLGLSISLVADHNLHTGTGKRSLADLSNDSAQSEICRFDAHHHARNSGLKGFGPSKFAPTVNPETGQAYDYGKDGFAATAYQLSTDQLGTQLDPPAHWNPDFPSIDELPPTFAVRPPVVISIVDQVAKDPKYALQVQDRVGY